MTEGEVIDALESYFRNEGFLFWRPLTLKSHGPDLVCSSAAQKRLWIIEAKGWDNKSENRRDSFESGLGQICHREPDFWKNKVGFGALLPEEAVTYGLAFPDKDAYHKLCRSVRKEVRRALALYFIFVKVDPLALTIIAPHDATF